MKNIIMLVFCFVCCLSFAMFVYSATDTADVTAKVSVNPVFKIDANLGTVDFGGYTPGESQPNYQGVLLKCSVNSGNSWHIKVTATEFTNGTAIIPDAPKMWFQKVSLAGTVNHEGDEDGTDDPLLAPAIDRVVYDSAAAEKVTNGTLAVWIDCNIGASGITPASGDYEATMTFTMYE